MKLIKINKDHFIMVDDSEIKEGDWFFANQGLRKCIRVDDKTSCPYITLNEKGEEIGHFHTWRGIVTHSTQPLEEGNINYQNRGKEKMSFVKIQKLSLSEVKELIGEVDVEELADYFANSKYIDHREDAYSGYVSGYNQALEDNKDKIFTEEDIRNAISEIRSQLFKFNNNHYFVKYDEIIQSLKQKTEWDVEYNKEKLTLKSK